MFQGVSPGVSEVENRKNNCQKRMRRNAAGWVEGKSDDYDALKDK